MLKPSHYWERRSRSRVFLELPLDYQALGSSNTYGGIAIDGSETGLFIHSHRHMPVGTQLKVSILFTDEFELANFKAVAKIIRKIGLNNGQEGYGYGLELLRIDEGDFRKFSRLLINHGYDSGVKETRYAAREQLKVFQARGKVIVVIDMGDLEQISNGKNFINMLRAKYEGVRLDLNKIEQES